MMKDLLHKYKEKLQSLQAEVEKNPKSPLLWKKLAELHLKVHGLETLEYLEKGILLSRHPEPLLTFKQEILASILHTLGNLSFRHGEKVSKIGFVSQGKILTASYDGKIRMWDISGREVCTFLGHEGPVLSFILTPNEEYLLSASEDKTIRIWDIHQGQELLILRSHEGAVTHLALAGANHFVSASKDGTARVWNLDNGKETLIFERHDSPLTALAVSGDGKLAATAGEDGKILLWVPENGKVGRILDGMTPVGALSFSATKRHLLSGLEDGTLMVWDAALGKAEKKYNIHTQTITEIQLLDKEVVVTCSQDGYAKGINLQDGKETFVIKTPLGGLASFGLHPNGKIAVTGGEEVVVRLWKFPKGGMLSPPMGPTLPIIDLSCCHYLATVSGKDFCQIWNPIKGTLFRTFIWKEMEFHKVALSPSGAKVACGDKKGEIRIWDVGESSLYRSFSEHQAPLTDIKYSPDGERLASSDAGGEVILWDLEKGESKVGGNLGLGKVLAIEFFPFGDFMVISTENQCLVVNLERAEDCSHFDKHSNPVRMICVNEEERVFTSSGDKEIWIWEGSSGKEVSKITTQDSISQIGLLEDYLVVLETSGRLSLWNLDEFKEKHALSFPGSKKMAIFKDENEVFLAMENHTIQRIPSYVLFS